MKRLLEDITEADIRTWPNPDPVTIPPTKRTGYERRRAALMAIVGGASIRTAAKAYNVGRVALAASAEKALSIGPDGRLLGFRACIPHKYRKPKPPSDALAPAPAAKGPGAFLRLLAATDGLTALVEGYTGPLPSGKRKCRRFDRFYRTFLTTVAQAHGKSGYPFDVPDRGRRALREHIKRLRRARREAACPEIEDNPSPSKGLRKLFKEGPLDRIEYDAHTVDAALQVAVPTPDGSMVLRRLQQVTLLVAICAVTRYALGYVLRFGTYNQLDVLRLFHRVLTPWAPRDLIVPGMHYPPAATIGLSALVPGQSARGLMLAGDNAFAHLAEFVKGNLRNHHRGVLNFGPAHIPEIRPIIEAFFRRLEEGALRLLAGAFQPATVVGDARSDTNFLRPEEYPIHREGFADLMDVIVAGHNVTPHSGLQQRLPAERLRAHLQGGGWFFETADTADDAARMTTVRIHPTVRGNRDKGKLPYIEWEHAKYRSPKLEGDWEMIGHRQSADVNLEDPRWMVLLDKQHGGIYSKLHALPPWDVSPHDLPLRKAVMSAKARGLLEIEGAGDAVEAYHQMVRTMAYRDGVGTDRLAHLDGLRKGVASTARPPTQSPPPTFVPRAGRFSFDTAKD